ncbi:MAG: sigma-54 dependent transcriptional regulator [Thermodesulfovibrionales bacterium]
MSIRILIVDDEEPVRRLLKKELGRKGYAADTAGDAASALKMIKESSFDVVLLDIVMPGMDGIAMLRKLKADPASPAIVVLTGKATVDTAVEAMKNGAYDYLSKPYKLEELQIVINRAYEQRKLRLENQLLQQELLRRETPHDFVGESPRHKEILKLIEKIAPSDSTVLILGESGTGKELAANYVWRLSRRNTRPLIALNCAAFSETLIESELFGHEKGAFTSAYKVKHGLVESAHEGTLFLDEIAEIPMPLQATLLRFLDSGEFRRVGGNKPLKADVRIIAATNRNLEEAIAEGKFREDLFYRLNVITIQIPPLRERKEDTEPLALYFLRKYNPGRIRGFEPEALEVLRSYDWPGNVRELENVVERAAILCEADLISPRDLSVTVKEEAREQGEPPSLEEVEREHILRVFEQAGGNQTRASRLLGIDRKTLYLKLKKYGVEV